MGGNCSARCRNGPAEGEQQDKSSEDAQKDEEVVALSPKMPCAHLNQENTGCDDDSESLVSEDERPELDFLRDGVRRHPSGMFSDTLSRKVSEVLFAAVPPPRSRASSVASLASKKGQHFADASPDVTPITRFRAHSLRSAASIGLASSVKDYCDAPLEHRPEQEIADGGTYSGQWRGLLQHGEGVLTRPNGDVFKGQFENGLANGRGILIASDGSKYDGDWCEGFAHGQGKYIHSNGSTYEGQWVEDEISGHGIQTWVDGTRFEGQYLKSLKHGSGTYRSYSSGNGQVYEGQFRDDKIHGDGRYRFADGRVYVGQWEQGHIHGQGRMEWPDGSKYEGGYSNDLKDGVGTFSWPDGRAYRGQWQCGKQHGVGEAVNKAGTKFRGEWRNGRISGAKHKQAA